jgi:hypothetical protein
MSYDGPIRDCWGSHRLRPARCMVKRVARASTCWICRSLQRAAAKAGVMAWRLA